MIDEFVNRMIAGELFYLKDSGGKVWFRKDASSEGYCLGHAPGKGETGGFFVIASGFAVSKLDDHIIYFFTGEERIVILEINIDQWEPAGE